jgi:hypothetical protein
VTEPADGFKHPAPVVSLNKKEPPFKGAENQAGKQMTGGG